MQYFICTKVMEVLKRMSNVQYVPNLLNLLITESDGKSTQLTCFTRRRRCLPSKTIYTHIVGAPLNSVKVIK